MKRKLTIFFLIIFFLIPALLAGKTTNDKIYKNDIIRLGGTWTFKGTFEKDILIFNGKIKLSGNVKGDVILFWSEAQFEKGTRISGDLILVSSKYTSSKDFKVGGKIHNFGSVKELKNIVRLNSGQISSPLTFSFFLSFFFWYVFILVVYAVAPEKIEAISEKINEKPLKSLFLGLLIYFIIIILILVFAVLSLFLIGIPFLLLLGLFIIILKGVGRAAISFLIGTSLSEIIRLKQLPPAIILVLGLVIIMLLKLIPILGVFLLLLTDSIAFGAIFLYKCKNC